ncbi:MAG: 3-methyl-2-oxobutanoate hydroxymethyltransferase [Phycisphaerae bacterium]
MNTREKWDLAGLRELKRQGRKFSVLTCYDAPTAQLMQSSGVDMLLVGDTAGEVLLGLESTRGTPVEYMLAITAAVRRGAPCTFVMADLPYACRQEGDQAAVAWCRRFIEETGCDAVKVEVTPEQTGLIAGLRAAGVPSVAHLGLLPQTAELTGGYRAQGRDAEGALALMECARQMESAGADLLLLEAVASEVAAEITAHSTVPVIGCVAGPHCDGTVVVLHDMLGIDVGHPPRAVKQYGDLTAALQAAFAAYARDVRDGIFPDEATSIHMRSGEFDRLAVLTEGA